jgi:hypothetical protein
VSTVILKHKITSAKVSMPCEQWEAWKDVPEMQDAFEVVEGSAGCTTCGPDPAVEEPAIETKASKSAVKNTSKESE